MEEYLDVFLIIGVVGADGGSILRWIGFGSIAFGRANQNNRQWWKICLTTLFNPKLKGSKVDLGLLESW